MMSGRKKKKQQQEQAAAEEARAADAPAEGEAPEGAAEGESPAGDEEPDLQTQVAELNDRFLRARAELENARRRARLDVDEARRHGAASLIQALLPVLDNLQRALTARPEGSEDQVWEGVALTEQMFLAALAGQGVVPVETVRGSAFDPASQKAVLEVPTDEQEPGTVLDEVMRGYKLHDRLLREAQVTVAKAPAEPAPEPAADAPEAPEATGADAEGDTPEEPADADV